MVLSNQQSISFRVSLQQEVSYVEPPATVAAVTLKSIVPIPANTMNSPINLATLFPALTSANTVALIIREVTPVPVGFNFAASTTDPGFPVRAGSIAAIGIGALQTIYVDNASLTTILELEITVCGS